MKRMHLICELDTTGEVIFKAKSIEWEMTEGDIFTYKDNGDITTYKVESVVLEVTSKNSLTANLGWVIFIQRVIASAVP